MEHASLPARAVVRAVLIVVAVAAVVFLVYLLRRPLGWLVLAAFVAVAVAAPVGALSKRMPRGAAIGIVYTGVVAVPVLIGALIVPRVVDGAVGLARDLPGYVSDIRATVDESDALRRLDDQFDIGARLADLADDVPGRIGDAAGALSSIGLTVADSVFALVTILILSVFMVANGGRWVDSSIRLLPEAHRERTARASRRVASAVSGYVRAQLTIALIAAVGGYVVMTVLGVPFRELLALLIAFGSLIPVIGSPLWGITIGLVVVLTGSTATAILWAVWALLYPQLENYVLQPQLQRKAVHVEPFVIIVAVLFGSTLLGIVGALLAIPAAATIQIVLAEWWDWRKETAASR